MNLFKKIEVPKPEDFMPKRAEEIDSSKRYDVYTQHGNDSVLIYRNVKFLGNRAIPGEYPYSAGSNLLLLEQADGTQIHISSYSYFCICEHGKKPIFEIKSKEQIIS